MRLAFNGIATLELFMNIKINTLSIILLSTLITGCANDESPFAPGGGGGTSTAPISDKNFNLFFDPVDPEVITDEGAFGGIEVTVTAFAGDKDNTAVNGGTVFFQTEWGILNASSCQLVSGSCSVTWTSDSDFGFIPADLLNTFTAYVVGEESYIDLDGSGNFNDADGGTYLRDLDEPFVDISHDGIYTAGDPIIDLDQNGVHTAGDSMFNGAGCTHTTLCGSGTPESITIYDIGTINLDQRTPP